MGRPWTHDASPMVDSAGPCVAYESPMGISSWHFCHPWVIRESPMSLQLLANWLPMGHPTMGRPTHG